MHVYLNIISCNKHVYWNSKCYPYSETNLVLYTDNLQLLITPNLVEINRTKTEYTHEIATVSQQFSLAQSEITIKIKQKGLVIEFNNVCNLVAVTV